MSSTIKKYIKFVKLTCFVALIATGITTLARSANSVKAATTTSSLMPANPVAGYAYYISGGLTPVTPTGTPADQAVIGNGQPFFDLQGNMFTSSSTEIDMEPAISGTYFGVNMTTGNVYQIAKTTGGVASPIGIGGSALALSNLNFNVEGIDSSDNVYFFMFNVMYMIPSKAGTYFGQSMQADYLYQVVGNGITGDQQNNVPALSAEFGEGLFTIDSSGNVYVSDNGNAVVDMVPQVSGTYFGLSMQADYIYSIAGLNNESVCSTTGDPTTTGTPAISTSLCNVERACVDGMGDLILADLNSVYDMFIPVASGIYYGQAMVANDIYAIVGGPMASGNFTNGEPPSLAIGGGLQGTDKFGNLYFGLGWNVEMMPVVSGTYFGQAMEMNHLYAIAGTGNRSYCSKFFEANVDALLIPTCSFMFNVSPDGNLYYTYSYLEGTTQINYILAIAESGSSGIPVGPNVISVSSTSSAVPANWQGSENNGSPITDYKVLTEPIGSSTQILYDTASPNTSYSLSSLTPGDSYELFVESVNANGTSSEVMSPPITVSSSTPAAPSGVTSSSSGAGSIGLSWTAPSSSSPITDYVVTVYPFVGTPFQIDTHSASTNYSISGLSPGSPYSFEVTAVNSSGYGASSTYIMAQVAVPPLAPSQPSLTSLSGGVEVSWNPPQSNGGSPITGYQVVTNQVGGGFTTSSTMTSTSYLESSLTPGDTYTFNVIAINSVGLSPPSQASVSITYGISSIPDPVTALGGSGKVEVLWATPNYTGLSPITDYKVTEYPGSRSPVVIDTGSTSNMLTLFGMSETTSYTFSVEAVNSYGASFLSAQSNVTIPATEPTEPNQFWTALNIPAPGEAIFSALTPNTDQLGVTGFLFNGCGFDGVSNTISPDVTLPGPSPCTTMAVSTVSGSYTSPANVLNYNSPPPQTNSGPPFQCANLNLNPISGGFNFYFTNQYQIGPVNEYLITVNPSTGSPYTVFSPSNNFNITGLSANESYTFTINCANQYGWSLPFTTWDPSPDPGIPYAPTGVVATPGNGSATLAWSAGSDNGSAITDYLIVMPDGSKVDTKSNSTTYTLTGLTNGTQYSFQVEAENANGCSLPSSLSTPVTPQAPLNEYVPISPKRIVDTRANSGYFGQGVTLGPKSTFTLPLLGNYNIPSNATEVSLNVTAADTTSSGYLVAYPDGASLPGSSNLNWQVSETKANLVLLTIGSDGMVDFYNPYGNADLIVDLEGYYAPSSSPSGLYQPISPTRICDTRVVSNQCSSKTLTSSNESMNVQVTGNGSVPSDAEAVVINLTATNTTSGGYLTVSPSGSATTSSLNWSSANDSVSNRVIATLSSTGSINISNFTGSTDVVVDVTGYFTSTTSSGGGASFTGLSPLRIADTRPGSGFSDQNTTLAPGASMTVAVAGVNGVPSSAKAAALNVTATNTVSWGYLSVTPSGGTSTSDVNWTAQNLSIPNLDISTLSSSGSVTITNGSSGSVDVVVDLFGYYS